MNELVEALYCYVRDTGLELACLEAGGGEYRAAGSRAEALRERLAAALSPEQAELLEEYANAELGVERLYEQALFHCGLTVGLALGSLSLR